MRSEFEYVDNYHRMKLCCDYSGVCAFFQGGCRKDSDEGRDGPEQENSKQMAKSSYEDLSVFN